MTLVENVFLFFLFQWFEDTTARLLLVSHIFFTTILISCHHHWVVIRGCKKKNIYKKNLLHKKHRPAGVERQHGPAQQLSALPFPGTSEAKLEDALVGQLIDWEREGHPGDKHGKHQDILDCLTQKTHD